MQDVFLRYTDNPLITVKNLPYQANAVFNAGVAILKDEVVLMLRVESCSGRSHLVMARSDDGITNWRFDSDALMHAAENFPYETNGVEDCRLTWMEDLKKWGIAYVGYSKHGPSVALATTEDFKKIDRMGLIFPPTDKNPALFPVKFNDLYAILHRPSVGGGSIWISYSPDLIYWGKSRLVLPTRGGPWWDGARIGIGPQPFKTDDGWLIIYHGVKHVVNAPIYRLGAALLDLDEPHKVIARSRRWLISPKEPYEQTGDAPNVIFSCGGFIKNDELWIYYGAADSSICLARAKVKDILTLIKLESLEK